jgi:hypothetical protein
MHVYSSTWRTTPSQSASLQRKNGRPVAVHLPHMFFERYQWATRAFSEHLASPWNKSRANNRHRIEYLGEDERDGLRCVVLREVKLDRESDEVFGITLMWLAIDRNYLPLRFERYGNPKDLELPSVVETANDWREVAPGVWFPFHMARYSIEDWSQENL